MGDYMSDSDRDDGIVVIDATADPQQQELPLEPTKRERSQVLAAIPPPIPREVELLARELELTKLQHDVVSKLTDDSVPAGYEAIRTAVASGVLDLRALAALMQQRPGRADSGQFMALPHRPVAEQVLPVEAPPRRSLGVTVGLVGLGLLTAAALVLSGVVLSRYLNPQSAAPAVIATPATPPATPPAASTAAPKVQTPPSPATNAAVTPAAIAPTDHQELQPITVATRPGKSRRSRGVDKPRREKTSPDERPTPATMGATSHEAALAKLLNAAQKRADRDNGVGVPAAELPAQLSRARMARYLRKLHGPAKSCFKRGNITAARTSVRLLIRGATGRVTSAEVLGRWSNSIAGRCLRRAARTLRFGRFSSATQTVVYPIIIR